MSYYPIIQSPNSVKAQPSGFPNAATKSISQKRPLFKILDNEDDNSRDSGYASQPTEEVRVRKKSRCEPSSMTDIYANCSPSKDEVRMKTRFSGISVREGYHCSNVHGTICMLDHF